MGGASLVAQLAKNLPAVWETQVQSLGQGRIPGEGNGGTLQYSCLENSTDGGHWWVTVHGISKELDTSEQLTQIHICIEGKYFKE